MSIGDAGTVRVPGGDGDLAALEQRDQLVGLGVEHGRALRERLDRLDARIDVLQRPALDLVQGQEDTASPTVPLMSPMAYLPA